MQLNIGKYPRQTPVRCADRAANSVSTCISYAIRFGFGVYRFFCQLRCCCLSFRLSNPIANRAVHVIYRATFLFDHEMLRALGKGRRVAPLTTCALRYPLQRHTQGGNKCHNPDFLGLVKHTQVVERFMGDEVSVHLLCTD